MTLLERTPRELERRMAAHLQLAGLAGCDPVMHMHHDLVMFYRELIQRAILAR